MTTTRTFTALGLAALISPLAQLPLSTAAYAATAEAAPPPSAATSLEQVELAGVDGDALADLRTDLVAGLAPAKAELLATDPAAEEVPTVLTPQLDVAEFTLAAVVWTPTGEDASATVDVRLREGGEWSEWQRLGVEAPGPDSDATARGTVGTEPLLSGGADGVQVRLMASEAVPSDPRLVLVDGGEAEVEIAAGTSESAEQAAAAPPVVTRAQWGADDRKLNGSASVGSTVRAVAVHHTAGTNNYSASNATAQIRSVYAYHTDSLGWNDVGYNFLVDKFGTVYEGRKGSIDKAVVGAHTGGFNTDTMGISALGNYETTAAPGEMVTAIGRLAGWKLGQYGVDPGSTVRLTSSGGGTSRIPRGQSVSLPAVFAHREVGYTACPGINLFDEMDTVRRVAGQYTTSAPAPTPTPSPTPTPTPTPAPEPPPAPTKPSYRIAGEGADPLAADIDGDGKDELGYYQKGWFVFETDDGAVYVPFGRPDDIPVTGDWDNDGVDGFGVYRAGNWHVRETFSRGPAERSFRFGGAGDQPVVGRWAGTSTDGIGVVRGRHWMIRKSATGGSSEHGFVFGRPGDVAVLGSWLKDGVARPGIVRGATWHLSTSIQNPVAVYSYAYGRPTDRPVVANVDGDRMDNASMLRDTTSHFRATHAASSSSTSRTFTG